MSAFLNDIVARAKTSKQTIVMPEGDDPGMPKRIAEEQIIHNRWLPARK